MFTKRSTWLLGIAAMATLAVALAAACSDSGDTPTEAPATCSLRDPECFQDLATREALLRPTPAPYDHRLGVVIGESALFLAATDDRTDGEDYWVGITQYDDPSLVQKGDAGRVTLLLVAPTTAAAPGFRAGDPCSTHYQSEGVRPVDHPCMLEDRTFEGADLNFNNVRVLSGTINVEERKVFNWFTWNLTSEEEFEALIDRNNYTVLFDR